MAKQFFKNLPDTSTPLTATRLNGLLDGDESQGNLVVESISSKNMFDKNAVASGYLDNTGTIGVAGSYRVSDYIPVIPGEKYTYQGTTIGTDYGAKIGYYNSSKVWVSYADIVSGGTTITIPSNIYYIRTTIRGTELETYQFEKGEVATTYSPHQNLDKPDNTIIVKQASTNLNDYTMNGIYFFSGSVTPTNIPEGSNGWLQVFNADWGIKQIWYRAGTPNSNDFETYVRTYSTSATTWSNWRKIYIEANTEWQSLTLATNFATYDVNNPITYKKVGNTVYIRGTIKPTADIAASQETTMFTLPSGYRPNKELFFICQGSGMNRWLLKIQVGGNCKIERYGTTSNIAIPTGAWLPITVSFEI